MRYRDQPTVEVTQRVHCNVATAWGYLTDITLPARGSTELQSVDWLDGDSLDVGGAGSKDLRIQHMLGNFYY